MLDQSLRKTKEVLLEPLVRGPLSRIHPNLVTRAAFVVGLLSAGLASQGAYSWALGAWLVNRVLDGLDGTLARVTGQQSDWGGYQDIVLDHILYSAFPLAVAFADGRREAFLACSVLQAAYFVNTISWCYLAALLEKLQFGASASSEMTSVTMPAALIEGTETVVFFSAFLLFPSWICSLFFVKALLVCVGVVQRWRFAQRTL